MQGLKMIRDGKPFGVRYFLMGCTTFEVGGESSALIEVNEELFIEANGAIEYERSTVRQNGCDQIVLTKRVDDEPIPCWVVQNKAGEVIVEEGFETEEEGWDWIYESIPNDEQEDVKCCLH